MSATVGMFFSVSNITSFWIRAVGNGGSIEGANLLYSKYFQDIFWVNPLHAHSYYSFIVPITCFASLAIACFGRRRTFAPFLFCMLHMGTALGFLLKWKSNFLTADFSVSFNMETLTMVRTVHVLEACIMLSGVLYLLLKEKKSVFVALFLSLCSFMAGMMIVTSAFDWNNLSVYTSSTQRDVQAVCETVATTPSRLILENSVTEIPGLALALCFVFGYHFVAFGAALLPLFCGGKVSYLRFLAGAGCAYNMYTILVPARVSLEKFMDPGSKITKELFVVLHDIHSKEAVVLCFVAVVALAMYVQVPTTTKSKSKKQ